MIYRKALFADVEQIFELINHYAREGVMLARSRNALYEALRDFIVAEEDGQIVGVGGVHFVWAELAEVRTLAVDPKRNRQGIGRQIVLKLTEEARQYGIKNLFTLTYRPDFFASLGYVEIEKEELHHKVWKDCINCPKFPNCDEVAMIYHL